MCTEIVAECGCSHLGDMTIAKAMIDAAKWAGADTAKFQMYETELINDPKLHLFLEKTQFDLIRQTLVKNYCKEVGIGYLCSCFDVPSLKSCPSDRIKIPSGQLHSKTYLECARSLGKPLILSTGMSNWDEVEQAVERLGGENITLLICNSAYPTPDKDANVGLLKTARCGKCRKGYSDHTTGCTAAIVAVALGAVMIEKHFMLSDFLKTPDTKTSLVPSEFFWYCTHIREAEIMLGTSEKMITESEKPNLHRRDYR